MENINDSPIIKVASLSKSFKSLQVLNDLNFEVKKGEFISILGPSGCGKSTLLKIIGGISKPNAGEVKLNNKIKIDRGEFGFVFQNPVLLPWRTLEENINLPLELFAGPNFYNVAKLIKLLGLTGFEKYLPAQLSGGMQQRVALARALAFRPSVLLMDEPFASLDEITRDKLKYEVLDVCAQLETTSIMVTHSITDAVLMSDKVVLLSSQPGKIVDIFNIELSKPRNHEIEISPEFINQVEIIRKCLGN